jgi:Domain of unknown function (DUF4375)
MASVRAIRLLAAALALLAAATFADVQAATDDDPGAVPAKKSTDPKDILVPIPSFSRDVDNNGCHVRASPAEAFTEPDADIAHVPFAALIGHAVGRYSVRAILDGPAKFMNTLAPLDADTRTLVLVDVLHDGLGRDGLHTFFFLSAAQHAPAIRDALATAGLKREHALFVEAMALFGPDYPIDNEARAKRFSYSSLDTPLNDFDKRMMEIARAFGGREAMGKAIVGYVERTPALWQRIEAQRAQLGEMDRLRNLNQALTGKIDIWDKPGAEVARRLAALPIERRTLFVIAVFNAEFENGGVHQFFYNSSAVIAPEVLAALLELGLDRQAAIFKRALDMFGAKYPRDLDDRRSKFFSHADWSAFDKRLSDMTDEFYALDGGPEVVRLGGNTAIEGGPGIWPAMAAYARAKQMLPC